MFLNLSAKCGKSYDPADHSDKILYYFFLYN